MVFFVDLQNFQFFPDHFLLIIIHIPGVYMGKSDTGDWFMFTVSVIDKVDPINYWVMPGDNFSISLRKQYPDIKW